MRRIALLSLDAGSVGSCAFCGFCPFRCAGIRQKTLSGAKGTKGLSPQFGSGREGREWQRHGAACVKSWTSYS